MPGSQISLEGSDTAPSAGCWRKGRQEGLSSPVSSLALHESAWEGTAIRDTANSAQLSACPTVSIMTGAQVSLRPLLLSHSYPPHHRVAWGGRGAAEAEDWGVSNSGKRSPRSRGGWRTPEGIPFCPQPTGYHPSVCLSVCPEWTLGSCDGLSPQHSGLGFPSQG